MTDHPLSSTRRTLPIALLRAREAVMEPYRPLLRRLDLTEAQWRVLRVLREHPEMDATQLAKQAVILAPSLTRVLKALEARGLITLNKSAPDRRRTSVQLAAPGQRLLDDAAEESARITALIDQRLGQTDKDALLDALEAVLHALEADRSGGDPA